MSQKAKDNDSIKDSARIETRPVRWQRYAWVLAIVWTVIVVTSLVWNVVQMRNNTFEAARIQARTAFDKDVIYRRWNAGHGGVYVPITEKAQPNPYLDVPERDIIMPSGKMYTLINPAYMTRQVHELVEDETGVYGHITSLNPIRPENAADTWETQALQTFERGETEFSSIEEMKGQEYMRLMRPLITEKGCLKCHATQGYQEGDIRGGISVSVPLAPLLVTMNSGIIALTTGHTLLWLTGLLGILLGTRRLTRGELERKQVENQLSDHRLHLEEANRHKSQFLTNMSHELRTPLHAIIGFSQILQDEDVSNLEESERGYAKDIYLSGTHLLSLISDILDLAKVESGKMELEVEPVKIKHLLEASLVMIKEKAFNHNIELVADIPSELDDFELMADERKLKQIIFNLLSNAVKFTPDGGKITMGCKKEEEQLVVSVTDTGFGIAAEEVEKVFKEFYQTKDSSKSKTPGTGLGLPLTRSFVEMHGGKIWAESELGKGSTFTFTLPKNRVISS